MKKITFLFFIFCSLHSGAQVLVKDIKPGSDGYPAHYKVCNGKLLFTAQDDNLVAGEHELWRTDGSANGTVIVKEINPTAGGIAANHGDLYLIGNNVYFQANDGVHGRELWKSDGTAEGTVMVKDINPSSTGVGPDHFVIMDGILYFSADDGVNGREPWKSDGTPEGTVMIKDVRPGQYGSVSSNSTTSTFTVMGGNFYFSGWDGTAMGEELWKSDGTSAGTVMVKNLDENSNSGIYPHGLTAFGDKIIFSGDHDLYNDELFISDGTDAGTMLLKDIREGSSSSAPRNFTVSNGLAFFVASDNETGRELWKTDGTPAGTVRVKDLRPGTADGAAPDYMGMIDFNGLVYFSGHDGVHGGELWKSDGTEAGTVMVTDDGSASYGASPQRFSVIGNRMYFSRSTIGTGEEFWESDGTSSGTHLVMDMSPGIQPSYPGGFTLFNNAVYFTAQTPSYGYEMWKYDANISGLAQFGQAEMRVYPNPFSDYIEVLNAADGQSYAVISLTGQKLIDGIFASGNHKIDTSGLQSGIYLLTMEDIQQSIKIVKR